jgi:membrane protease YdiL (CAAX protease family)
MKLILIFYCVYYFFIYFLSGVMAQCPVILNFNSLPTLATMLFFILLNLGVAAIFYHKLKAPVSAPFKSGLFVCRFAAALALLYLIAFLINLIPVGPANSVIYTPPQTPFLILLTLSLCLGTGYSEELFFRAVPALYTSFKINTPGLLLPLLLFAAAHAYAGFKAMFAALLQGAVLSACYFRYKNIHLNALVHAFYNFSVLLLT